MKIFEFLIGEDDDTGVKTISLVDSPAMQSDFIAFNEVQKKPVYISLEKKGDEYKGIVAGLSMIPDKLIYRVDPDTNEEYYGYFTQDTIEKIRNKYHKEMQTSNVNLDHDDNAYINAYLIESYILSSEARVEEVKAQGIKEATLGAWYTQFKIEDEEVFEKELDRLNKKQEKSADKLKDLQDELKDADGERYDELLRLIKEEQDLRDEGLSLIHI